MPDIKDYFDKFGFGDGGSEFFLEDARCLKMEVMKKLNEEFEKRNLPYRVIDSYAWYFSTSHNPVRLELAWEENGKQFEWSFSHGHSPRISENYEENMTPPKGLLEVFEVVQNLF